MMVRFLWLFWEKGLWFLIPLLLPDCLFSCIPEHPCSLPVLCAHRHSHSPQETSSTLAFPSLFLSFIFAVVGSVIISAC